MARPGDETGLVVDAVALFQLGVLTPIRDLVIDARRRVIARALRHGMIIDLAPASEQAMTDFMRDFPGAPFMLSHTGIRTAACLVHRNLSEEFVRAIAAARP